MRLHLIVLKSAIAKLLIRLGLNNKAAEDGFSIKKGFSILEIPIAMTVLTIGLLFLFGVFPTSFSGVSKGKNILSSAQVAEQILQRIQSEDFETAQSTSSAVTFSATSTLNGATSTTTYVYTVIETAYVNDCTTPTAAGATACSPATAVQLDKANKKDEEVFVYISDTWDLYRYVTRIAR